jgi:XisH protein
MFYMAKDKYHELVKQALIDEGWTITDDPFQVSSLIADLEVDLAAEKIIAAEKGTDHIAIEVKSFLGKSWLHDFYKSVGQFGFYHLAISHDEPNRTLYLALPNDAFQYLFKDPISVELARINHMKFIVFNVETKKIVLWKK